MKLQAPNLPANPAIQLLLAEFVIVWRVCIKYGDSSRIKVTRRMRDSYDQRHVEKIEPRFYVIANEGTGHVPPAIIVGVTVAVVLCAGAIASALAVYMN